jgi:hypothetical protein
MVCGIEFVHGRSLPDGLVEMDWGETVCRVCMEGEGDKTWEEAMSYDVEDAEGKAEGERAVVENPTIQELALDKLRQDSASPDVTKDAAMTTLTTPAYFTDGEMLPWKGRWFRVKLLEVAGQKIIGLVSVKDTASATKRAVRTQRWYKQHPRAVAPRPGSQLPFTPRASSPA